MTDHRHRVSDGKDLIEVVEELAHRVSRLEILARTAGIDLDEMAEEKDPAAAAFMRYRASVRKRGVRS